MTEELEKELKRSEALNQEWERLKQEHQTVAELLNQMEEDVVARFKALAEFKKQHAERLERMKGLLGVFESIAAELDEAELQLTKALTAFVKRQS